MDVALHAAAKSDSVAPEVGDVGKRWLGRIVPVTAALAVGSCGGISQSPYVAAAEPVAALEPSAMLDEFTPDYPSRFSLDWTYETEEGMTRGRAVAWFIPPDSLRFDYRAPFGRRGAAVFIGQDVIWATPEETVKTLIPATQLFWVVLGIPIPPAKSGPPKSTLRVDGWALQYVTGDTVLVFNYTPGSPPNLTAMLTHDGRVYGTAYVAFSDSTALPVTGRMMFPRSSALFSARFRAVDTLALVDRGLFGKR